jgi:hypothetical protein
LVATSATALNGRTFHVLAVTGAMSSDSHTRFVPTAIRPATGPSLTADAPE